MRVFMCYNNNELCVRHQSLSNKIKRTIPDQLLLLNILHAYVTHLTFDLSFVSPLALGSCTVYFLSSFIIQISRSKRHLDKASMLRFWDIIEK